MLVALPLICFALLYRLARPLGCWRRRLLMSMTAWGLAGVVITEALGAFGLLRRGPLALAWGLLGWRYPPCNGVSGAPIRSCPRTKPRVGL